MMSDFSEKSMKDFVKKYPDFFSPTNKDNPTGKSYRDWTSKDLRKLSTNELGFMRAIFNDEQYAYTDQLLPSGMNRQEFSRAILRVLAERGEVKNDYLELFSNTPTIKTQKVTVMRTAFGGQEAVPSKITEIAAIVAIRDASVDIALNNTPGMRMADDVAVQVGRKNDTMRRIDSDVSAYDFGYTVGAMSEFKQPNGLNIRLFVKPPAKDEADIRIVAEGLMQGKSDAEIQRMHGQIQAIITKLSNNAIQKNYCPTVDKIYQPGKSVEDRDAMVLGFAQARVDGRDNFKSDNDRIGLFADCPKSANVR